MTIIPHHILVPTDFSMYADRALAYAVRLATALQSRLTLLHVIHSTLLEVPGMETEPTYHTYLHELEETVSQTLQGMCQQLRDAGIPGDIAIVHGVPYHEIIEIAAAKNVDLIVMGSHGRTGLAHVLLGSVAERVVRLAPCSVLVVRETEKQGA
jgi:nucleotide-binding universal stress UspA family protein